MHIGCAHSPSVKGHSPVGGIPPSGTTLPLKIKQNIGDTLLGLQPLFYFKWFASIAGFTDLYFKTILPGSSKMRKIKTVVPPPLPTAYLAKGLQGYLVVVGINVFGAFINRRNMQGKQGSTNIFWIYPNKFFQCLGLIIHREVGFRTLLFPTANLQHSVFISLRFVANMIHKHPYIFHSPIPLPRRLLLPGPDGSEK